MSGGNNSDHHGTPPWTERKKEAALACINELQCVMFVSSQTLACDLVRPFAQEFKDDKEILVAADEVLINGTIRHQTILKDASH